VDALAIPSGVTTRFLVGASWAGISTYFDFAPNVGLGLIPLPVSYATTPPPVAPVAAPVPSAKQPAAPAVSAGRCTVPPLRGMTQSAARARLRSAGCAVGTSVRRIHSSSVRRGRVIRATVGAHARTSSRVGLVVSLGSRPRRARKADGSTLDRLKALVADELREVAAAR
jgi:hypothetical protein